MCEQRFGSPLFGLVSHEVPERNGSNMTSSGRTKDRVEQWREKERGVEGAGGCEKQSYLKGGRAKASADVLEIRIWEVNMGREGRKEGREVSGWDGNSQWKEGSNSNIKRW